MADMNYLTDDDVMLLKGFITILRNQRGNPVNRPFVEEPDLQPPEVYVALTPQDGIAGLLTGTGGTGGSDVGAVPGNADCYIYRLNLATGEMEYAGFTKPVYNVSATAFPANTFVLVEKDKWGNWFAKQPMSTSGGGSSDGAIGDFQFSDGTGGFLNAGGVDATCQADLISGGGDKLLQLMCSGSLALGNNRNNLDAGYGLTLLGGSDTPNVMGAFGPRTGVEPNIGNGATGNKPAILGGVYFNSYADAGCSTTVLTQLIGGLTINQGTLHFNGDKVRGWFSGIFANTINNKEVAVYALDGTLVYDTGTIAFTGAVNTWSVQILIVRVSNTVARIAVEFISSSAVKLADAAYTEITGLDLDAIDYGVIAVWGKGGATNDVVLKMSSVEWLPAAYP